MSNFKGQKSIPPKLGMILLKIIGLSENQIGDLEEEYNERLRSKTFKGVSIWLWMQIFSAVSTSLTSPKTAQVLLTKVIGRRSMTHSPISMAFICVVALLLFAPHDGVDIIDSSLPQTDSPSVVTPTKASKTSMTTLRPKTNNATVKRLRHFPPSGKFGKLGLITANLSATPIAPPVSVGIVEAQRCRGSFAEGKQTLAAKPQDIATLINLVKCGLEELANGNGMFTTEATNDARMALRLMESHTSQDESIRKATLGWLNCSLGIFTREKAPSEAAKYFFDALQFEEFKNDPYIYAYLADCILGASYIPLQETYSRSFITQEQKETPEAKTMMLKLNLVSDQIIELLAHAIGLADSNRELAHSERDKLMKILETLYKFRNSGYLTGLEDYIRATSQKLFVGPLRLQ